MISNRILISWLALASLFAQPVSAFAGSLKSISGQIADPRLEAKAAFYDAEVDRHHTMEEALDGATIGGEYGAAIGAVTVFILHGRRTNPMSEGPGDDLIYAALAAAGGGVVGAGVGAAGGGIYGGIRGSLMNKDSDLHKKLVAKFGEEKVSAAFYDCWMGRLDTPTCNEKYSEIFDEIEKNIHENDPRVATAEKYRIAPRLQDSVSTSPSANDVR